MGGNVTSDAPPHRGELWFSTAPDRALIDLTEGSLQDRILTATLTCLGRWGTVKTTLDDIAREAGCSRATVYRVFPGGRDALFVAAGQRELFRSLGAIVDRARAAASAEELAAEVLASGVRAIREHRVLAYLLEHEPGVILPYISFDGIDPLLEVIGGVLTPELERFCDPATARAIAEWLARVGISYGFDPTATGRPGPDLADPGEAHRFVSTYLFPKE